MGIFSPPEKGKTPLGTEEKGKRFYPILGVFSLLYWEKLPKGITKVITTIALLWPAIYSCNIVMLKIAWLHLAGKIFLDSFSVVV